MSTFGSLCTEYYDIVSKRADPGELSFFKGQLQKHRPPYLEAMCGSGRLLIPLVEKGLKVHGVDSSQSMLERCQHRLGEKSRVTLFHAPLETMMLPCQYGSILVAAGSFQLIARSSSLTALQNLRSHLAPKGSLILEVWVPWQSLLSQKKKIQKNYNAKISEGISIEVTIDSVIDRDAQSMVDAYRYVKYQNGRAIDQEEELLEFTWYYRHEMELLLEKAGFRNIEMKLPKHPLVPDSQVFIAQG